MLAQDCKSSLPLHWVLTQPLSETQLILQWYIYVSQGLCVPYTQTKPSVLTMQWERQCGCSMQPTTKNCATQPKKALFNPKLEAGSGLGHERRHTHPADILVESRGVHKVKQLLLIFQCLLRLTKCYFLRRSHSQISRWYWGNEKFNPMAYLWWAVLELCATNWSWTTDTFSKLNQLHHLQLI